MVCGAQVLEVDILTSQGIRMHVGHFLLAQTLPL